LSFFIKRSEKELAQKVLILINEILLNELTDYELLMEKIPRKLVIPALFLVNFPRDVSNYFPLLETRY